MAGNILVPKSAKLIYNVNIGLDPRDSCRNVSWDPRWRMIEELVFDNKDYRHSLWTVAHTNFICVSVCVSACVFVCPAFTAYISLTMGRTLIKIGENVGTFVQLIVLKFHKIGLVLT